MDDLLALAIDAHGGMKRWERISRFRATLSITGAIWDLQGKPGLLTDVVLEGETHDQRIRITPFPATGRYATWEPEHQTIETDRGLILTERRNPSPSIAGPDQESPWDDLQVASFAGQAIWNALAAPFLFARPDFVVQEIDPWSNGIQVWRRLFVTYPDNVVAYCRQQMFYFDDDGSLRQIDYVIDILGGVPAVQYPSDYREFDGIMVPTRRRAHVRSSDGSPLLRSTSFAIDVTRVVFD
jgi:hypothetical protein